MLRENQFGITMPDGARRAPLVSALTGKQLEPGDMTLTLPGTRYVVGVKAMEWKRLKPAQRQAMKEEWAREVPRQEPSLEGDLVEQDYEAMTADELRSLAAERGVDLAGRGRGKEGIIQALRADDVRAQFRTEIEPEAITVSENSEGE